MKDREILKDLQEKETNKEESHKSLLTIRITQLYSRIIKYSTLWTTQIKKIKSQRKESNHLQIKAQKIIYKNNSKDVSLS